jgi:cytochrome c-type biogenesis protein CcmH/NrfG
VSDSLSFAEHLLARAHLMLQVGRPTAARKLLNTMLRQPGLSHRLQADGHRMLAGIELEAGRFRRTRRHLAAAIRLRRHADELYFEYARAVHADPEADPRLAVKAMRRAVGIDPFEPRSWAALGRAARLAGDAELARKAFCRAARLRPEEIDTLAEITDGLVALGLEQEARAVIAAAQFRLSKRTDVIGLCNRVKFLLAANRQRQDKVTDEPATLLPFPLRPAGTEKPDRSPVILRADRLSRSRPHLLRLFGQRIDPRRAN